MKKALFLLFFLSISSAVIFSQQAGKYYISKTVNGVQNEICVTIPERCESNNYISNNPPFISYTPSSNGSYVRWQAYDGTGIGNDISESGNGQVTVNGWLLNNKHVDVYGNSSSTPQWSYTTDPAGYRNCVAVSDTGGFIAVGANRHIIQFDKNSNVPIADFDLATMGDTGTAGPLAVTRNGAFLVASACRNDSSKILGFARGSNTYAWRLYIQGGQIYGVRISGNDSLAIVNTYSYYMVINTYTGAIRYQGAIANGTQNAQGISGNGNLIALINYHGNVNMLQWNGSAYTALWTYQEPTGTYYNWINCVDISYDGAYVAAGTLNFLTSSTYDGKIRFFKVSNGSTPLWSMQNTLDEISAVCFSKNGKVLAATSWGPTDYSKDNIFVLQANPGNGVPAFTAKAPGSPYACGISDDGTTVVTAGKQVHARLMGYGGNVFNIFVDTNFTPNGIRNISGNILGSFRMYQNYPNPFNPSTTIKFDVPAADVVRISVYNTAGELVASPVNQRLNAGSYETVFDGSKLGSGLYYALITAGSHKEVIKMALIK
ncbi:MAG: WD40 repeat domain-containing protein [Bacteroidetes bacterium]|nr:WD40 repeat domain-containing protein [Bacteroidota bacterium]